MTIIRIKCNIQVNPLGQGGHVFYTENKDKISYIGGIIYNLDGSIGFTWVYVFFPDDGKFEPDKFYQTNIDILANDMPINELKKYFNKGKQFYLRMGVLYDDKFWATGEILEILDEESVDK